MPGTLIALLMLGSIACDGGTPRTKWYQGEGGTLHNATVVDWKAAIHANRLATCADFVAGALERKGQRPPSLEDLKLRAERLLQEMDKAIVDSTIGSRKVSSIAAGTMILMGW